MRKTNAPKKLDLTTHTVRSLSRTQLVDVDGGAGSERCTDTCPSHAGTCGSACRPE